MEELGVDFGDVKSSWVVVTPGLQLANPRSGGAGFFLGIIGLGAGQNEFRKGPAVKALEEASGVTVSVDCDDSVVFTFFPARLELFLIGNVSMGLSFSGLLAANSATDWKIDGERIPDVGKMFLSHYQVNAFMSIWVF